MMTPYEFSIQTTSPVRQVHSVPLPRLPSQLRLERFETGQWTPVTCQVDRTSDPPTLCWLAVAKPNSPRRYRLLDGPPAEAIGVLLLHVSGSDCSAAISIPSFFTLSMM